MTYAKQRQDLLDDKFSIPVELSSTGQRFITLEHWTPVLGDDDDGNVFTVHGILNSIDLEYREVYRETN